MQRVVAALGGRRFESECEFARPSPWRVRNRFLVTAVMVPSVRVRCEALFKIHVEPALKGW
ncbi:MAG: hypothetical protein HC794_04080 [Nitrospiraceae bacterium]|nr:hypothetical protein [Nitrospiraceae bacterium]